jgi:hypothetical protein
MFLVSQFACGLFIAIFVLAWWHEIGAIAAATLGGGLLLLVAASSTWADLLAVTVIGGTAVGAVWLGTRYEALEWDDFDDGFSR